MLDVLRSELAELARQRPGFRVFVLTGAGISRESGLATFRDSGGLWERYRLDQVATPEAYQRNPALVHEFYSMRRRDVVAAQPNEAHLALRELEQHLGDRFTLVTQNVDDLHDRAGSRNLIHMHGEVRKLRCLASGHILEWSGDADCDTRCPQCGSAVRPHIVWFGEMPLDYDRIDEELKQADLFCAIGTSGTVYPAAGFVSEVRFRGGLCVEVNLQASGGPFDVRLIGPATVQVPVLVRELVQAV